MGCIYKGPSGRHCSKNGSYCPGSGAFLKCYTEKDTHCDYCFNARIAPPDSELTDKNDFSSKVVGTSSPFRSICINSGNGESLNIEFSEWDSVKERWKSKGRYYPKYCPECGRSLKEYEPEIEEKEIDYTCNPIEFVEMPNEALIKAELKNMETLNLLLEGDPKDE